MKIEAKPKATFNPLVITLETPEELAGIFAIINNIPVSDAVGLDPDWDIHGRLIEANQEAGNPTINHKELSAKLREILK